MKLAITGSFGWKDIGDEAMLTEDLRYIGDVLNIPREDILLIGGEPDYLARYHDHPRENCFASGEFLNPPRDAEDPNAFKGYRGLVKDRLSDGYGRLVGSPSASPQPAPEALGLSHLRNCSAALITGGGTVNSRDELGHSVHNMHSHLSLFQEAGLPIFMSGQTIGPFGLFPGHDKLGKEIVEMVDVLSTRDSLYSKRYIDMISATPKEHIETFDDAYTLEWDGVELPPETEKFLNSGPSVTINITLYTGDTEEKRAFMAKLCEHIVGKLDYNVVLLSHAPWDFPHLHIVADQVDNAMKKRLHIPDTREWRDRQLKRVIASGKVAIGGRYHFIVFAGTSNTPFVGMAGNHYSYVKQDGFARPLGLEDYILNERQTWDFDTVVERIDSALKLKLELSDRFTFPSASMERFGKWLQEIT